jgi:hypothetical protein
LFLSKNIVITLSGYDVHTVRTGRFATGFVPAKALHAGEEASKPKKRAVISYNGDDPQHKVTSIRQDEH